MEREGPGREEVVCEVILRGSLQGVGPREQD